MIKRRTLLSGALKLGAAGAGFSFVSRWMSGNSAYAFPPDPYWEHCAVLRMIYHENPLGPAPEVFYALEKVISATPGPNGLNRFPDENKLEMLLELILEYNGLTGVLKTDSVLTGVGSTELLIMASDLLVDSEHPLITEWPTYNIIIGRAKQNQGHVIKIPALKNPKGVPIGPDYDSILRSLAENQSARLIHLNVTNNPTGCIISDPEFTEFARLVRASHPDALILADSSDPEFADPDHKSRFPDFGQLICEGHKILWIQTFSHIWGMTGLRLGYGIASPDLINSLRKRKIYNGVSTTAVAGGIASLLNSRFQIQRSYLNNKLGREYLASELKKLGLTSYPSQGAYLLFDTKCCGLVQFLLLMLQGIWIRPGLEWDLPSFLRVNPGKHPEENEQFIEAMKWISSLEQTKLDLNNFLSTPLGVKALDSLRQVHVTPAEFLERVRN